MFLRLWGVLITKVIPFGCLSAVRFSVKGSRSDKRALEVDCLRKNFCYSAGAIKTSWVGECFAAICSESWHHLTPKVNRHFLETLESRVSDCWRWEWMKATTSSNKKSATAEIKSCITIPNLLVRFWWISGEKILSTHHPRMLTEAHVFTIPIIPDLTLELRVFQRRKKRAYVM